MIGNVLAIAAVVIAYAAGLAAPGSILLASLLTFLAGFLIMVSRRW